MSYDQKKEEVWPKKSEYKYKIKSPLPDLVLRNDKLRTDAAGDAPTAVGKRADDVTAERVTSQATQKGFKARKGRGDRAESVEGLLFMIEQFLKIQQKDL